MEASKLGSCSMRIEDRRDLDIVGDDMLNSRRKNWLVCWAVWFACRRLKGTAASEWCELTNNKDEDEICINELKDRLAVICLEAALVLTIIISALCRVARCSLELRVCRLRPGDPHWSY